MNSQVNVARGKPTRQSSTYEPHSSSRAVDGNKAKLLRQNSCTHTSKTGKEMQWWMVDLKGDYQVIAVVLTSRGDGQFSSNM